MKILFWAFVAIDVVAIGIFAVLALAAAGPSRTNPVASLMYPALGTAILLAAIWMFVNMQTPGPRLIATVIAALPALALGVAKGQVWWELREFRDEAGNIQQFSNAALRRMEAAIAANDAAAVTAAAREANVNATSLAGATPLVLALRQLRKTPQQLEVVRALLAAGADPNAGKAEHPLQVAIGVSREAGSEPVRLLLEAGANPNAKSEWGDPVFFVAGGAGIGVDVMKQLLARGADVQLKDGQGRSAVVLPATTRNWPVVITLLESGAPWRDQQGPGGVAWRSYVEREAVGSTAEGAAAVLLWLGKQDGEETR